MGSENNKRQVVYSYDKFNQDKIKLEQLRINNSRYSYQAQIRDNETGKKQTYSVLDLLHNSNNLAAIKSDMVAKFRISKDFQLADTFSRFIAIVGNGTQDESIILTPFDMFMEMAINIAMTEQKSQEVELDLSYLRRKTKTKNPTDFYNQVKRSLYKFGTTAFWYPIIDQDTSKMTAEYIFKLISQLPPFAQYEVDNQRPSTLHITIDPSYYNMLINPNNNEPYKYAYIDLDIYNNIDLHTNVNAPYFIYKIYEKLQGKLYNTKGHNKGKTGIYDRQIELTIAELINCAPGLKESYIAIQQGKDRHFTRNILCKIERDLKVLKPYIEYRLSGQEEEKENCIELLSSGSREVALDTRITITIKDYLYQHKRGRTPKKITQNKQ